jgi:hypothetical protein
MSKLLVKYNSTTKEFTLEVEDLSPYYTDIFIGIFADTGLVQFTDFSFGYTLEGSAPETFSKSWPDQGVEYIQTDQPFLESSRIYWGPGNSVQLTVWFNNNGIIGEKTWTIQVPELPITQ